MFINALGLHTLNHSKQDSSITKSKTYSISGKWKMKSEFISWIPGTCLFLGLPNTTRQSHPQIIITIARYLFGLRSRILRVHERTHGALIPSASTIVKKMN
jgi:hypothetical protein